MSDLPPDLPRLQAIATWLELTLTRVREAIATAEEHQTQEASRPRWWIQWDRRRTGVPPAGELHQEGCWRPGAPHLHAEEVRRLVAEHAGRIRTCPVCQAQVPSGQ